MVSKTMRAKWKRDKQRRTRPKIDSRTFEEMSRDLERQREAKMMEAWRKLWREGDWKAIQGRLED